MTTLENQQNKALESSWLGAVLLLPPLALFGELLLERTHHRPLGAATFSSVAVVSWFFIEAVTKRALEPTCAFRSSLRTWAWRIGLTANAVLFLRAFL